MSAPYCLSSSWGEMALPTLFDILCPSASSTKPWVSTCAVGRRSRECRPRPAARTGTSRGTGRGPRGRGRRARRGRSGRCRRPARWLTPESNQTSRMSFSLPNDVPPHAGQDEPWGSSSAGVGANQASAPSRRNSSCDVVEDRRVERSGSPQAMQVQRGDRHAPEPLARDAPVGAVLDHARRSAVSAPARDPLDAVDLVRAPAAAGRCASMRMNHCSVARKMTGFLQRQQCG